MCDESVLEYIERTCDPNPHKRRKALRDLCPCHVRADIPQLWERIFECLSDEVSAAAVVFKNPSNCKHDHVHN